MMEDKSSLVAADKDKFELEEDAVSIGTSLSEASMPMPQLPAGSDLPQPDGTTRFGVNDDAALTDALMGSMSAADLRYIRNGRPRGDKSRSGVLLHPFGDDDIISRTYSVSVGFFGILIILVLLLSPFSKIFFQAVDNLAEGVTWLQGLSLLVVTLLFGVNLVLIQGINRPTRGRCAFTGSSIMLATNTAICILFLYVFIDQIYLDDCSPPRYGPPKGGAMAVNDCPAYGTRCESCAGHGEPRYNPGVVSFYPGISCVCDPGWGPSEFGAGRVKPCSTRTDVSVTSISDMCTDCNYCNGNGWAIYAEVSRSCTCACAWGEAEAFDFGGETCPAQPAATSVLSQVLFAFLSPDAQKRQEDAALKQFQALLVVLAFISLAAVISVVLYGRLVMYHRGCASTPKAGVFPVFSDKHRMKMRVAALSSFGPRRTCLPRPSAAPPVLYGNESIPKRFWFALISMRRFMIDSVNERGAFVYPLPVLVCAFVTPVVLVYSCAYMYFMMNVYLVATVEQYGGSVDFMRNMSGTIHDDLVALNDTLVEPSGLCHSYFAVYVTSGTWPSIPSSDVCHWLVGDSAVLPKAISYAAQAHSFLGSTNEFRGNLPTAMVRGLIAAQVFGVIYSLMMVWKNVRGFKRWTLASFSGQKVPGYNITTNRAAQDLARSSTFVAIFVSTHLIGMLVVVIVLWAVFTLLGWTQFEALVVGQLNAILAYVVAYIVVKVTLKRIVCNKWLSTAGSARHPRALSDFIFCLSIFHIFTGLLAAVTRLVMFIPIMFYQFCRLDENMFPEGWQSWDTPFRACQSLVQHHTRTTNPLAFAFAESLFEGTKSNRTRYVAASHGDWVPDATPPAQVRARTRWHLTRTLINNPSLCELRVRPVQVDPENAHMTMNPVFSDLHDDTYA